MCPEESMAEKLRKYKADLQKTKESSTAVAKYEMYSTVREHHEKVAKLEHLERIINDLEKRQYSEYFRDDFNEIKLKLKDKDAIDFLESKIKDLEKKICSYTLERKKDELIKRIQDITSKCKDVKLDDVYNSMERAIRENDQQLMNQAEYQLGTIEKSVAEYLELKENIEKIKIKCNEINLDTIRRLLENAIKENNEQSMNKAVQYIQISEIFVNKYLDTRKRIEKIQYEYPSLYNDLVKRLTTLAANFDPSEHYRSDPSIFSDIENRFSEGKKILALYVDLVQKVLDIKSVLKLDIGKINELTEVGKNNIDKKSLDKANHIISFVWNLSEEIQKTQYEIERLNLIFFMDVNWKHLLELYNDFTLNWDEDLFQEISYILNDFIKKQKKFDELYPIVLTKINELEKKNQKIKLDKEKNLLDEAKKSYNIELLLKVEEDISKKSETHERYLLLCDEKKKNEEYNDRLADMFAKTDTMTQEVYKKGKESLDKKIEEIQKQIEECNKILFL